MKPKSTERIGFTTTTTHRKLLDSLCNRLELSQSAVYHLALKQLELSQAKEVFNHE